MDRFRRLVHSVALSGVSFVVGVRVGQIMDDPFRQDAPSASEMIRAALVNIGKSVFGLPVPRAPRWKTVNEEEEHGSPPVTPNDKPTPPFPTG